VHLSIKNAQLEDDLTTVFLDYIDNMVFIAASSIDLPKLFLGVLAHGVSEPGQQQAVCVQRLSFPPIEYMLTRGRLYLRLMRKHAVRPSV
jgi:hypothetical protein